jgi:hypothetical protein
MFEQWFGKGDEFKKPKTSPIFDHIHLIDVGPTDSPIAGVRVIKDLEKKVSIQCVARLVEPYTQLLSLEQVLQRVITPLDTHFRAADSIGEGEHMQILRHLRPGSTQELDLLEKAVDPQTAMAERASETYLQWGRNYQAEGSVPGIDTWIYLTVSMGKERVTPDEMKHAVTVLQRRFERLGEAFRQAGYEFYHLKDERQAIEADWQYFNPERSKLHSAPKPHHQLMAGNLRRNQLQRNPHLAVESIRQQLGLTPYQFKGGYAFAGDGTYQRLLTLQTLPDDAKNGLEPLYRAQDELSDKGVGLWISQHWRMRGKKAVANELTNRQRKAEDMYNSLGDRVDNSSLGKTMDNLDEMRERAASANEIVEYALTLRVDAPDLATLDWATNRVITGINELPGAELIQESFKYRIRKTWQQCAPGSPVSFVDYEYRGKLLCADHAVLFLPRYGHPKSDSLKDGMPYSIFWTPQGMPVRIAPWGIASSSVWAIYGPPGRGKGVVSKAETQQFMAFNNTRVWYIDNNDERTSVDFQVKLNDGLNVRLTDASDICLSPFMTVGRFPTGEEFSLITDGVWFDITRLTAEGTAVDASLVLRGATETILDEVLRTLYDRYEKPNYDNLVDLLLTWPEDDHSLMRHDWATSLQVFCSREYLSRLRGKAQYPGKYYRMFGRSDGLELQDLFKYPIVSFNLAGISNQFVKQRLCMILNKMIMSYGIFLSNQAVKSGITYYLDVKIDEGWSLFRFKGGPEMLDELVRKHRHVSIRLQFITQLLTELMSDNGKIVLNAANHFVVLGAGESPKVESEVLGLTQVEQAAITNLSMVPGYSGQFFFRRKEASGNITTMVLENPVPYTETESWMPILAADGPEGTMRLRILSLLGAESIAKATTGQCMEAASILARVWPHGLRKLNSDTSKRSDVEGWPLVLELVHQYQSNQSIRQSMEEVQLCAAE